MAKEFCAVTETRLAPNGSTYQTRWQWEKKWLRLVLQTIYEQHDYVKKYHCRDCYRQYWREYRRLYMWKITLIAMTFFLGLAAEIRAQTFTATLNWTDNSNNEAGFVIERQLNKGLWTVVGAGVGANVTQYVDSTLVQATTPNEYCYRLRAWNTADGTPTGTRQYSAYSNEACKTIAAVIEPPGGPTSLTVSFNDGTGSLRIGNRHFNFTKQDGTITISNASNIKIDVP